MYHLSFQIYSLKNKDCVLFFLTACMHAWPLIFLAVKPAFSSLLSYPSSSCRHGDIHPISSRTKKLLGGGIKTLPKTQPSSRVLV